MITLKKKIAALTMALSLLGAITIPIGTSSQIGSYLASQATDNVHLQRAGTAAGAAAGGAAGAWAGAKVGGSAGSVAGPVGTVVGAAAGAL
jgi:hypothetical protein